MRHDRGYFLDPEEIEKRNQRKLSDLLQKVPGIRIAEAELLPAYHAALVARGVDGYAYDECWRDYRLATINQFSQVIALYALIDVNEKIDDDVTASTGERLVAALVELDLVDLVPPAGIADVLRSGVKRRMPASLRRAVRSVLG